MGKLIDVDELLEKHGEWYIEEGTEEGFIGTLKQLIDSMPEAVVRCRDCKHWRQQTNYQGALLSFGFCESDDMWRSLYGETYEVSHIDTDDYFYCGYAERRTDDTD